MDLTAKEFTMDRALYNALIEYNNHWWFRGRREIVDNLIKNKLTPRGKSIEILDVGSGAGSMIPILQEYGKVSVLEPDQKLTDYLQTNLDKEIRIYNKTFADAFFDNVFDVITFFDVLEHIEDDNGTLEKAVGMLKKSGYLICTVPAFPFLWSIHDETAHHQRRYTKRELRKKIESAGLSIERITHFNTFLFLPIALMRIIGRFIKRETTNFQIGGSWLNDILYSVFSSERSLLNFMDTPFGVSLFCIAKKRK